jgi:CRP-like cAMP-binding protein
MRRAGVWSANILLNQLSDSDAALLHPHLSHVRLERGEYFVRSGRPIEHLYFLDSGIASIVSDRRDDVRVELAVIGREGVTGIAGIMGADTAPQDTFLQLDHGYAQRIETHRMAELMDSSASLRSLMLRFVQTIIVQLSGNAAANVSDRLDARLARWLLMCHDRVDGDDIALTHEFIAMMIGAPRTAVTSGLHQLEGFLTIRTQRGRVTVIDRAGLENIAGSAYGTPEREYRRLIGPFGKSPIPALQSADKVHA